MIRNQWYIVLDANRVKNGRPVGVTRLGEKLVFWRDTKGKVFCMRDQCPHIGAKLSQGKVIGDALACPFHGFEYNTTGQCTFLPAYGRNGDIPKALKVATYPVHEAHGYIWLWWGDEEKKTPEPRWVDINDSFTYASFEEEWPVHYSRMIENQLDVMHLSFIHPDTIGRGGRYVVDGPIAKMDGDLLQVWVHNRTDDGTPPKKAEELPEPTRPPFLLFSFPNLWENRIAEEFRLTAAFIPIDESHTLIHLRTWHKVKTPIIREIFNFASTLGNKHILHQDRRVVLEQRPIKTNLRKMGEKLTQSDRAILTYRTHRQQLKEASGQIED